MITSVRLLDGSREMAIYPRDGIAPQSLTVGFPDIREVVEAHNDDDGERDSTRLHGGRAVSLEMVLYEDEDTVAIGALLDELKTYLHPRLRPYLYVVDDGWSGARRVRVRVSGLDEPYTGYVSGFQRAVQAQWRAPDGIWEDVSETEVTINADLAAGEGIEFPIEFPIAFAQTTAAGALTVTNSGGAPSHFVARLYGPCTAPRLVNETTATEITFTSALALGAGEYVEIDTRDHTAFLLSMTSQSRLSYLDFEVSRWWRIDPGAQQIRYAPESVSAGSVAVITYRPAWL